MPGLALQTRSEGVQDITLSDWTDNGDGSYTQMLTAGTTSGSVTLTPQINGESAVKNPLSLISSLLSHPATIHQ